MEREEFLENRDVQKKCVKSGCRALAMMIKVLEGIWN